MEPLLKSETSENDMVLEVLDEIWQKPKGDVLVFVPGEREIKDLSDIIKNTKQGLKFAPFFAFTKRRAG